MQSMHAEQYAIFSLTGASPSLKAQGASVAGLQQQVQLGAQAAGAVKRKEEREEGALLSPGAAAAARPPRVFKPVRVPSTPEYTEPSTRECTRASFILELRATFCAFATRAQ
jgi:hypothetical protein